MKLPNGYGSVVKLSGKRRKPWMVRKTTGYRIDPIKEKKVKAIKPGRRWMIPNEAVDLFIKKEMDKE